MKSSYALSPGGHIFNRQVPKPLPPHMMITRSAPVSPVVDLRQWEGPLKNQGQEGSCTGHAGTECGEWVWRKYRKQSPIFSPQYTYAKELIANGNFPQDDGSDGTTLCQVIIANGLCELSSYPYVEGNITQPTPAQDADAAKFQMVGAYHGLVGSVTANSVLADPVPWTIVMGFTVYASFESDEVASTGIYNPNPTSEQVLGGHEVHIVGCDLAPTPTLRPSNCPPAFLVMNSWGSGWGWNGNGHFWAVPAVLNDPETDLKVFHLGPPWKK